MIEGTAVFKLAEDEDHFESLFAPESTGEELARRCELLGDIGMAWEDPSRVHASDSSTKTMKPERIQLLCPTNRTIDGPLFRHDHNRLVVEYDFQYDDGSVRWSKLIFLDVLAIDYRQFACCADESVVAFDEVRIKTESKWLSEVLDRWNKTEGWVDWQRRQGGASRFGHYSLFFDEAGCINTVAASCEIVK